MTESDAYAVMLMRAFESPPLPPWSAEDSLWLTRQAAARGGANVEPQALLAQRARLGLATLGGREPALRPLLQPAAPTLSPWLVAFVLALAALLGAAGGVSVGGPGPAASINLLAPPLFALLAWNLLVYAALLFAALGRRRRTTGLDDGWQHGQHWLHWLVDRWSGWQRRNLRRRVRRITPAGGAAPTSGAASAARAAALSRFGSAWWQCSASLQRERLALLLHLAAAALALGALVALYAGGLAVEVRAGWSSTFLGAAQVRLLFDLVYGPAASLLGIGLPDHAGVAALRLDGAMPSGRGGENAARWIHLIATTVALFVLLPRAGLAARAAWRLRRLTVDFQLPPGDDALDRLMRAARSARGLAPVAVSVLPYSYQLAPALRDGLARTLDQAFGPGVAMQLDRSLPLGAEDELAQWLPRPLPPIVVALFALTATPEADSHGAFLRALAAALGGTATLRVMIDESGFRARFAAADERLAQRRLAWQRLLQGLALRPDFVDLSRPPSAADASGAATSLRPERER